MANKKSAESCTDFPVSFETLVMSLPGHVYWFDRNSVFMGCNLRQAQKVKLSSSQEIVGKTIYDFQPKEYADKLVAINNAAMDSGLPQLVEEHFLNFEGEDEVYLTDKVPLFDDERKHVIGLLGISFNISERKQAESALQQRMEADMQAAKEQANLASTIKTEFMQNMQHDLRTPASGVAQMLQFITMEETEPQKKEVLGKLANAAQRLLNSLNDILAFSKIDAGSAVMMKKFNLHEVINDVIAMEVPTAHSKNLELQTKIADNVPQNIISDKQRIMRILLNLVGNAIKFTNQGYVKVEVSVTKQISPRDMILQLKVIDTGIGIPHDKIYRIYEQFERCLPSSNGLYAGSGLGLSITKHFVTELNGEIDVESEEGKGSTFTCLLPCTLSLMDVSSYEDIFPTNNNATS